MPLRFIIVLFALLTHEALARVRERSASFKEEDVNSQFMPPRDRELRHNKSSSKSSTSCLPLSSSTTGKSKSGKSKSGKSKSGKSKSSKSKSSKSKSSKSKSSKSKSRRLRNGKSSSSICCEDLVVNGNFEAGFANWQLTTLGACIIVLNDGTNDPDGPGDPIPPIEGQFDVLTEQGNEGLCSLRQQVALPDNIVSATLSWQDRIRNFAAFEDPNQEARVRVCLIDGNGLQEVWSTNPGDPTIQLGPNFRSFDVTALVQGSDTVAIQFDEQDDLTFFNMNWDTIMLNVCWEN